MKAAIGTKLSLLLPALALVPLLTLTWLDYRATRALASTLAEETRASLRRLAEEQLEQLVDGYSAVMLRESELVEMILLKQAREVELRLADVVPPAPAATVLFDSDLDAGRGSVRLGELPRAARSASEGSAGRVPVTYDTQAFRLPPEADGARASFAADIARLASMTEEYRAVRARNPDLLLWQYTTLESGLHSVYPGHGGYPVDYDPRLRPWYIAQKHSPALTWHEAQIDASTREVIVVASLPVHHADGSFAGVTAVDLPITAALARFPQPSGWAAQARFQIVMPEAQRAALRVYAKQDYETQGARWSTMLQPEWIAAGDARTLAGVVADMRSGRSGTVTFDDGRTRARWAYRTLGRSGTFLLVIVPEARVNATASMAYDLTLQTVDEQLRRNSLFVVLAVGITLPLALFLGRRIAGPLGQLVDATRRVAAGDFNARVDIRSGDELQLLGETFNATIPQLEQHMRYVESLALARKVQQNLLPRAAPQSEHFDIHGVTRYCEETGGDYFDYLDLTHDAEGQIGTVIGDVSGHGVSSALVMATVRALLHSYAAQGLAPAAILSGINRHLTEDVHEGRFMTLFYLVVDGNGRALRWSSAGHDPALLYRAARDEFVELAGIDIPLGVEPAWEYRPAQATHWLPGDVVLLATDGIWECRAPDGTPFGKERLRAVMRAESRADPVALIAAVFAALDAHRGAAAQRDDMTIVVVKARD